MSTEINLEDLPFVKVSSFTVNESLIYNDSVPILRIEIRQEKDLVWTSAAYKTIEQREDQLRRFGLDLAEKLIQEMKKQ
jgi:hypothetical protein